MQSITQSEAYRHVNFALMAIAGGAEKMGISEKAMYERLKAQGLVHRRLFRRYEELHTQSPDYVADDIVETLLNWEAARKTPPHEDE